jgi:hypothetical protein
MSAEQQPQRRAALVAAGGPAMPWARAGGARGAAPLLPATMSFGLPIGAPAGWRGAPFAAASCCGGGAKVAAAPKLFAAPRKEDATGIAFPDTLCVVTSRNCPGLAGVGCGRGGAGGAGPDNGLRAISGATRPHARRVAALGGPPPQWAWRRRPRGAAAAISRPPRAHAAARAARRSPPPAARRRPAAPPPTAPPRLPPPPCPRSVRAKRILGLKNINGGWAARGARSKREEAAGPVAAPPAAPR